MATHIEMFSMIKPKIRIVIGAVIEISEYLKTIIQRRRHGTRLLPLTMLVLSSLRPGSKVFIKLVVTPRLAVRVRRLSVLLEGSAEAAFFMDHGLALLSEKKRTRIISKLPACFSPRNNI
jgi:hypothetical protein